MNQNRTVLWNLQHPTMDIPVSPIGNKANENRDKWTPPHSSQIHFFFFWGGTSHHHKLICICAVPRSPPHPPPNHLLHSPIVTVAPRGHGMWLKQYIASLQYIAFGPSTKKMDKLHYRWQSFDYIWLREYQIIKYLGNTVRVESERQRTVCHGVPLGFFAEVTASLPRVVFLHGMAIKMLKLTHGGLVMAWLFFTVCKDNILYTVTTYWAYFLPKLIRKSFILQGNVNSIEWWHVLHVSWSNHRYIDQVIHDSAPWIILLRSQRGLGWPLNNAYLNKLIFWSLLCVRFLLARNY